MEDLMERYRETRDESLIEEFKLLFDKELKVKGLWDYDDYRECDEPTTDCSVKRETYSRLKHFEEYIKAYQGRSRLRMSDKDVKEIKDYLEEKYDDSELITRSDLIAVCKVWARISMVMRMRY